MPSTTASASTPRFPRPERARTRKTDPIPSEVRRTGSPRAGAATNRTGYSWADAVEAVMIVNAALGQLVIVLFPLAIPALALVMLAAIPLVLISLIGGLLAAPLGLVVVIVRRRTGSSGGDRGPEAR